MQHILKEIVETERKARAIVADVSAEHTKEEQLENVRRINENSEAEAAAQISAFTDEKEKYLADQTLVIERRLKEELAGMDEAYAARKDEWIEKLYNIALGK